jgi:hypothetical protein
MVVVVMPAPLVILNITAKDTAAAELRPGKRFELA